MGQIVPLFTLLVAGVQLLNFLRTMKVRLQGGTTIYRHERPVLFWFYGWNRLLGRIHFGLVALLSTDLDWLIGTDRSIRMESWDHFETKSVAFSKRVYRSSLLLTSVGSGIQEMHLQNRVTPFGEIVAISQRGMFTGNRGIIHDPVTKTLLTRRWSTKTWLVCSCEYKGRRRSVMAGRSWTELFFLDEAVALSAGHRPCFLCRREAAELFRAALAAAKGTRPPAAAAIDAVLHRERLEHGRKRVHPIPAPVPALPDGAVVVAAGSAFTLSSGLAHRWTNEGYDPPVPLHRADGLLTPPSTLMALCAGYRPVLHPSITAFSPFSHDERSV